MAGNTQMPNDRDQNVQKQNLQEQEAVEFTSSMPEVQDEDVEFIPDQRLETRIEDNQ